MSKLTQKQSYQQDMKKKLSGMAEEEIKSWNEACQDAFEPTEEMKKSFEGIKPPKVQTEWQDKNSERVKSFFKKHWNDDEISCVREDVIYSLSTMLFDCNGNRKILNEIKETFPDLYSEAVEWYASGHHDT